MSKCIFYCDIEGTYKNYTTTSTFSRHEELQYFVKALDYLCEITNEDEMYFCFVSSDHISDIIDCVKEISPYIKRSKHIKLGTSFADKHKVYGEEVNSYMQHHSTGKVFQIINNIEHIINDIHYKIHGNIDRVYFADDVAFQHEILSNLFPSKHPQIKLVDFMLGKNNINAPAYCSSVKGLQGVINAIQQYGQNQQNINNKDKYINTDDNMNF